MFDGHGMASLRTMSGQSIAQHGLLSIVSRASGSFTGAALRCFCY